MRIKALILATTFVLVPSLLAGCSSDSDSGGTGGGTAIPLNEVGPLFAKAQCDSNKRCFGDLIESFQPGEDCEANATKSFQDQEVHLQELIDAGTVTYDGTKVQACLDAVAVQDCSGGAEPQACKEVVVGTVDAGGNCNADDECTGESFCSHSNTCPGSCTAKGGTGASCTRESGCTDGLSCDEASGTCLKGGAAGDDCDEGAPECAGGLFCIGSNDENGTPGECKTIADAFSVSNGMTCGFDSELCANGLSCVVDSFDDTGAVFKCASRVDSGACKVGFPEVCPAGQYCDAPNIDMADPSGTCEALAGKDEACTETPFGGGACGPNLRCDDGTCRELQLVGGTCSEDSTCFTDNCVSGRCSLEDSCK